MPPDIIGLTARKSGLFSIEELEKFNETEILSDINMRLAPKFREMIMGEGKQSQ